MRAGRFMDRLLEITQPEIQRRREAMRHARSLVRFDFSGSAPDAFSQTVDEIFGCILVAQKCLLKPDFQLWRPFFPRKVTISRQVWIIFLGEEGFQILHHLAHHDVLLLCSKEV